jgi:hypothetical protein
MSQVNKQFWRRVPGIPRAYLDIQRKCMDPDQRQRSNFSDILVDLLAAYSACMEAMSLAMTSSKGARAPAGEALISRHPAAAGGLVDGDVPMGLPQVVADLEMSPRPAQEEFVVGKPALNSATAALQGARSEGFFGGWRYNGRPEADPEEEGGPRVMQRHLWTTSY